MWESRVDRQLLALAEISSSSSSPSSPTVCKVAASCRRPSGDQHNTTPVRLLSTASACPKTKIIRVWMRPTRPPLPLPPPGFVDASCRTSSALPSMQPPLTSQSTRASRIAILDQYPLPPVMRVLPLSKAHLQCAVTYKSMMALLCQSSLPPHCFLAPRTCPTRPAMQRFQLLIPAHVRVRLLTG